mgnify:CR=1 FL=1
MKRSEINAAIKWSKELLYQYKIKLPQFGYWSLDEWKANIDKIDMIRKTMLGWDITDYGSGDFDNVGSVLFTIRNGGQNDRTIGTPYAEKLIIIKDGQRLPTHFHYSKTEDIINRGGGVLELKLYNSKEDFSIDYETDVVVYCDGIEKVLKAGKSIEITTGNSITLTPYTYHNFGAKKGAGPLITGEVSSINDDNSDNHFAEKLNRFANIDEDEEPVHPLCNEYNLL